MNRSNTKRRLAGFVLGSAMCLAPAAAWAQRDPAPSDTAGAVGALRVFFDCNGPACDFDFYRREVPFVNYTRNREDAQVHVLVTSQRTGSGGRRFTLDFIGQEEFEGLDDRLEVTTRANLAAEQQLSRVAATLKLGLLRYIARTDQADEVEIVYAPAGGGEPGSVATPDDDPWNFWTFRVRGNGNFNKDERTEFIRFSGGLSADRVTEGLKLNFSVNGSYNESTFEIDDETTVTSIRRSYNWNGLAAWSLSDHWSIGGQTRIGHSTFANQDLELFAGPAIEYNLFPYSESTRRQLSFLYSVGYTYFDFMQETVFLKMTDGFATHSLDASLSIRQPWGGSFGFLRFTQFLDEPSRNRFDAFAGVDLRLFKGLSLNFNGSASRVRDQINLPAGDATQEEILLRQRELQTGFEYGFSVGFSYTFGSIFSNVVNPRFGGGRFFN